MMQLPEIKAPIIPAFMDVAQRPIRCRLDGAIVDVDVHGFQASLDAAPYPVYEFECPVCGDVDEIS